MSADPCSECNRPRPREKLPPPFDAIVYCVECNVPFTLAEISMQFREANLLDSNSARCFRGGLVDDLVSEFGRITKIRDLTIREAFVQGFVAAKNPKTAHDTLVILSDAESAYDDWRRTRSAPL